MTEFERFWAVYPRRVGKFAAQKALTKALTIATLEDILAGVEMYKQHKPSYADWAHARTWLAQGRWMDEWEEAEHADDRGHVPPCRTVTECINKVLGRKESAS